MSAALQNQGAMPGGQQPPAQITAEMLMQIFNIGEAEAKAILQALPQLCQAAQPQLAQGEQFQQIQQEAADVREFKGFLDILGSPIVTPVERMAVLSLDYATLFEVARATNRLAQAGTPTKDALARIAWSDAVSKNVNAKQIAQWILEVLMPRIINPIIAGQTELVNAVAALSQERMTQQGAAQGMPPQQGQPAAQPAAQQAAQQGQRYPWKNSKGDSVWYKIMTDASGKKIMSDSLEMDIVKDSIKVDETGVLTADAVMTAAMVQTYMKDGKEQRVLKDPKELKKACDVWLIGMPCTDTHPPEGIVMNQDEVVGWTTPPQWDANGNCVRCRTTIFDKTAVKKIQDGKTDVSIGFFCDLHEDAGKFGTDDYEAVQRNIVFNHLAVGLDKGNGRCPDGTCGIIRANPMKKDAKDEEEIDWELYKGLPCVGDNHYTWLSQDMEDDAKLSAQQRAELPESDFCGPGKSFPVPDCAHYSAALRMLPRYQGPGDKAEIKACIMRKGTDMTCPGAADAEMTLHEQLLREKMNALVEMSKKLAEAGTTMTPEDLEKLMDGIRELMWKLRDEIAIIRGQGISVAETSMKDALAAMGDAAILQHNLEEGSKKMKEGKYRLEPGYPDTHDHFVELDANGSGTSTVNDEHQHQVVSMEVQLANNHSHNLVPQSSEEETPMSDEDKTKQDKAAKDAADKAAAEAAAKAPKNKAKSGDEAEPPAEKPAEKDEASQYVEKMIKREHTALVDAIMDHNPPKPREVYEKKSLDELKETKELLDAVSRGDNFIPAGKTAKDGTAKIDEAYATLENNIRTKTA